MSGKMSLLDTIQPKSDQLNYDDVAAKPIAVKITGLAAGNNEQPVIVKIANLETGEQLRDYKPCKSMRRVMIYVWGDKGKDLVGKSMVLSGDPSVRFGGQAVGGIRISHMEGLTEPRELILTTTRGKRAPYVVQPMPAVKTPPKEPEAVQDAQAGEEVGE